MYYCADNGIFILILSLGFAVSIEADECLQNTGTFLLENVFLLVHFFFLFPNAYYSGIS